MAEPLRRDEGWEAVRLKRLEEENKKLKEVVAELTLDKRMLKLLNEGNW